MEQAIEGLKEYYDEEQAQRDYLTFLRFQTVSTDPLYREEITRCSHWLQEQLEGVGLTTTCWPTASGIPVIFGERIVDHEKPTILIYNHYDVQPPEPLDLWESPPFEPRVEGKTVFCRGAQDNKGQCSYVLAALRLMEKKWGKQWPVNVKWCIEGEEECGSAGLAELLEEKSASLSADALIVADLGIPQEDVPAVVLGVRGITTLEVNVKGATVDLHSGSHGGIACNPIHALAAMIAGLHNSDGSVAVPGFYNAVTNEIPPLPPFDEEGYEEMFGARPMGGEEAYPAAARGTVRPTLEVNGISGGYTGPGFKTVIPSTASAKISCRLVPNQEPAAIQHAVKQRLEALAPAGVSVDVALHPGSGHAVHADPNAPIVNVSAQAYSELFGKKCLKTYEGGSIPITAALATAANADIVLLGLGLLSDNIHAPNEHFGLDRLKQGALIIARTLELYCSQ